MSDKTWKARKASNRRHIRWVYLKDAWPECPSLYDGDGDAIIMSAPAEAVITALDTELEKLTSVLDEERALRRKAEGELERLKDALGVVLGSLPPERQLSFDDLAAVTA